MLHDIPIIHQDDAIEAMLAVGMSCLCHGGPGIGPYKTIVRGWQRGAYIIAEVLPTDDGRPPLRSGEACLLKFRRDGRTWEFHSRIDESWDSDHSHHFRFSWPRELRPIITRQHERIEAVMPCNVVFEAGDWVKGHIRDIGAGGCRLCLKTPSEAGSTVQVSFTLPDGTTLEDVRSLVRTVSPFGRGAFLGCQFDDNQRHAQQEVELFVATQLEQSRTHKPQGKRVLVIERNPRLAAGIRRALERRDFDVATASGLVEGFALLRTLLPSVLMVNAETHPVNGLTVCEIVRDTPGFRKLPVFLYGPEGTAAERQALDAGASGYIPYPRSGARIVDTLVSLEQSATPGVYAPREGI